VFKSAHTVKHRAAADFGDHDIVRPMKLFAGR
jgi:hypothetical protein